MAELLARRHPRAPRVITSVSTGDWQRQVLRQLTHLTEAVGVLSGAVQRLVNRQEAGVPTRIALKLPTRTVKGIPMPNFELPNDEVVTITIETTNSAGVVEPYPAGDVFTAKSSSPSLGAAVGVDAKGNPAVVLTPLVQSSPGIVVTVADSGGLSSTTLTVDIVPDVTDTNIVLDVADATHVAQAIPVAPGP